MMRVSEYAKEGERKKTEEKYVTKKRKYELKYS